MTNAMQCKVAECLQNMLRLALLLPLLLAHAVRPELPYEQLSPDSKRCSAGILLPDQGPSTGTWQRGHFSTQAPELHHHGALGLPHLHQHEGRAGHALWRQQGPAA